MNVLFKAILADMRSHIDARHNNGVVFWLKVFGKAILTPAIHVVIAYRVSHLLYQYKITRPLAFLLRSFTIVWGCTEIHPAATIGPGLCLVHSQKVLIGAGVIIGRDARISHGVSIGSDTGPFIKEELVGWPVLGDGVTVALDAIIIGPVRIGDCAFITARSMVTKDVPARGVVAGSPARLVRILDEDDLAPNSPVARSGLTALSSGETRTQS